MKIIDSESIQGIGKYNNDIINNIHNMCYVMDGASSLFNDNIFFETSDLYEYMQLLRKNISDSDSIINNIKNGIIESNKKLINLEKYKEYELPTFAIAAVKEYNDHYMFYLLCDCLISILYKNGNIENIQDNRFDLIKIECRKQTKEIDDMNLEINKKIELKRPIWREYRKFANVVDGYPVGSTNSNSIENGIIKIIAKSQVDKILICTDGLYSELGIPNDKTFFDKEKLRIKVKKLNNKDDLSYILIHNE